MDGKPGQKYCRGCKRWLALGAFAPAERMLDGRKVWCRACIAVLDAPRASAKKRAYQQARRKAYQTWYRAQGRSRMIDKRWACRPDAPVVRLRWNRRLGRVSIYDGTEMTTEMRALAVGAFGCDPGEIAVIGRGGGSGREYHPRCKVEGSIDEEGWTKGLARLAKEGWAVLREGFEDVVAVGR